ncbi:MAG: hypothetical protein Aurels2KO_27950 [Aureliella sp.]
MSGDCSSEQFAGGTTWYRTQQGISTVHYKSTLGLLILSLLPMAAIAEDRVLFSFDRPADAGAWQSVNDGVMGGRSIGRFRVNSDKNLEFFGSLSLLNNGGFASVRARRDGLRLEQDDVIVARVRGDGRAYQFNLYAQPGLRGYSYRQPFKTTKGRWIEVEFPISKSIATWRGGVYPNEKLDPSKVAGMGILLGDKRPGAFKLEVDWIKVRKPTRELEAAACSGTYSNHLQGVCTDEKAIYWSFTTELVKSDLDGKTLAKVPVANHHGDLCIRNGKIYVAVNLGKFNDPAGNADSWVYVYDAQSLKELSRHETQEVFHGAGGVGVKGDHFFVVGGLPDAGKENFVYEYDSQFSFVKKHVIKSGHTHLGIQTATFAHDRWWFGCYGTPQVLLVTDAEFNLIGRHKFDCSLGIEGLSDGRLLIGSGGCAAGVGCTGAVKPIEIPSEFAGK